MQAVSYFGQLVAEVVAVLVQEVVLVAFVLVAHGFDQLPDLVVAEVGITEDDGLSVG